MSDLLLSVRTILADRSREARQKGTEAKGTYARFMLNAKSDEDTAEAVVAAADQLGIGTEDVIRDLVHMAFAKAVPTQIQENENAVAKARAAILEAKRELTAARGRMSADAIHRANANLRERVSDAVALEEWGESLQKALAFFKERGETFKLDVDAAAAAQREAEQRKKQLAAPNQAPRAPANFNAQLADADSAADHSGKRGGGATSPEPVESAAPAKTATPQKIVAQPSQLGEPIIPDLTPKPVVQ